ncbi:MAG TPA: alpha/beta hydrolase [Lysobacter sp.]|nr:alpha/beta hydrolase [Lysobacter sp.]
MRRSIPVLVPLLLAAFAAPAAECPSGESYEKAREVVRDLQRIVTPGGIDDTYATTIGGIAQSINVRGEDRANPMILFVHGGPASPTMPGHWQFQRPLEEYFTIAHYDQRGAGKTHRGNDPDAVAGTLTIQRYVDDAVEVAEHLRAKYGKRKLILVGHSWGTVVGMKAALARPDLFHAYVGMGQVINTRENERLSFEYGLAEARRRGDATAVAELEAIAPYPGDRPITRDRIITARKWPQQYGGMTAYRDAEAKYYYGASLLSPEYDCADRKAFFDGSVFTLDRLLDEFLEVDFTGVTRFPVPVAMFMGRHDYTTPSAPAAAWLARVQAPAKHAVWFEHASHMIPWEEPGHTLVSLLQLVRPLAVDGEATAAAAVKDAAR